MIKIEDVTYTYSGNKAGGVKHINLDIAKGECVLFCGKSGCGKTTITRLINGLIPHFHSGELKGNVYLDGTLTKDIKMHEIASRVGSVFQNPKTQFFNVDASSEIAFVMENLSYAREKIVDRVSGAVADLGLEELYDRSIFKMSGGERQKIAFASIYALSPDIYVLDEPSSNLDIQTIEEIRRILIMLKSQGKTIIIAEHRLYFLKGVVDRVVYMEDGAIKDEYSGNEFFSLSQQEREQRGLRHLDLEKVELDYNLKPCGETFLEVKGLELYYGKTNIMKDINFQVSSGEVVGIIGNNGQGKSTLARVLCGIDKKYKGSICYDGANTKPKDRLKFFYMVLQDVNHQLFSDSVEGECALGYQDECNCSIEDMLKELDLYKHREKHPMALSGGEKQRLVVATSILCNKDVIIFDEPTSGLDFNNMKRVSKLIHKLSKAGKIVFVITHDYELVTSTCHKVIEFRNRKISDIYEVSPSNHKKLKKFFIV
ncbi:ABC transporter ATP-binding protein [Clostridium amazonitimonense]|uniref:ABC transporter ATP-binding protein n=1 Tax=Clostridium amazonitimonense TaxID=1499689 RepID=UPI00050A004A|nr:energy-coupling factor ABC transporter ATP-binding protein [Clostridium amazonitimonense]